MFLNVSYYCFYLIGIRKRAAEEGKKSGDDLMQKTTDSTPSQSQQHAELPGLHQKLPSDECSFSSEQCGNHVAGDHCTEPQSKHPLEIQHLQESTEHHHLHEQLKPSQTELLNTKLTDDQKHTPKNQHHIHRDSSLQQKPPQDQLKDSKPQIKKPVGIIEQKVSLSCGQSSEKNLKATCTPEQHFSSLEGIRNLAERPQLELAKESHSHHLMASGHRVRQLKSSTASSKRHKEKTSTQSRAPPKSK